MTTACNPGTKRSWRLNLLSDLFDNNLRHLQQSGATAGETAWRLIDMQGNENEEVLMSTADAVVLLDCSRRWLRMLAAKGKVRKVVAGHGRGNKCVWAVPVAMLPKGYRGCQR